MTSKKDSRDARRATRVPRFPRLPGLVLVSALVAREVTNGMQRKPFVEPTVSAPSDALAATRVFAGQLGQVILGGGSNGTAIDDGDYGTNSYYDSPGQDGVDGGYDCGDCL